MSDLARCTLPPRMRDDADLAVLDVTEFYGDGSGGVRTYLDRKAAYVAARPWLRHVLLVPGARDDVAERDGSRTYRLRGPRVPLRPPYRFMLALRQPRRIVEHERPHIVEIGSPGLVPWVVRFATRRTGARLVHFWHSHYPRTIGAESRARRALAWEYARRLDRHVSLTVAASAWVARDLRAAGIARVAQVPLGVDLARFHPARRAFIRATRARLGVRDESPLVVYVGRFAPEKRLDVLLAAWPHVARAADAQLVLLGDGSARPELETLATRVGPSVRLAPFEHDRDRLADVLAAADLVVSPCPVETFGLATIEAFASGTAVLGCDDGGAGELIAASGGGATFRANDPDALAASALTLLQRADLRAMGATAREYAERHHDWSSVFDRLFALYAAVARDEVLA